jgi:hypothetical protein
MRTSRDQREIEGRDCSSLVCAPPAAAMARTPLGLAFARALVFAVAMPAVADAQAPAPAPTSDGESLILPSVYIQFTPPVGIGARFL